MLALRFTLQPSGIGDGLRSNDLLAAATITFRMLSVFVLIRHRSSITPAVEFQRHGASNRAADHIQLAVW